MAEREFLISPPSAWSVNPDNASEKYADGNVPKGILLLHRIDGLTLQDSEPLPLGYDFFALIMHKYEVEKKIISNSGKIWLIEPRGCDHIAKEFANIYAGPAVKYRVVHAEDFAHLHHEEHRPDILEDVLDVLETAHRAGYPAYYNDGRELKEIKVYDSCPSFAIFRACDDKEGCMRIVDHYFSEIRAEEMKKEAQAVDAEVKSVGEIEPSSLLAANIMIASLPPKFADRIQRSEL